MNNYRQAKTGTWHILYMNRSNCDRYKNKNWMNDIILLENQLPVNAKICKKCFVNNR